MNSPRLPSTLSLLQGIYYLVTGVWPIVSPRTFQKITGPKADMWLVKTFGAVIGIVGILLTAVGIRQKIMPEAGFLGLGSAASLAASDILYSGKGRISKVYMLEGLVEVGIVVAWVMAIKASRPGKSVT